MGMEADVVEESWSKTPVAKRPRLADDVKEALNETPPPVLSTQSEPRQTMSQCFDPFTLELN